MIDVLGGLTAWHWLALALALLVIEVSAGTFDLLWIAIAAALTSVYAAIAPSGMDGWQAQFAVFAVIAVILVIMGRTVFAGIRRPPETHPNLNNRAAQMVGKRGHAAAAFDGGVGRVKLGDSEWRAEADADAVLLEGAEVVVESAKGTILKVRPT
ncbi:MAG: NfeD family protein [Pseudomonadota bacterium]